MNPDSQQRHALIEEKIAIELEGLGYRVTRQPAPGLFPFSLSGYRPDLLAQRPNENVIVEIKGTLADFSVERYRNIAEIAASNGWKFFLVSPKDVATLIERLGPSEKGTSHRRLEEARTLMDEGKVEAAFLILWSALEGILRRRAEQVSLPIDGLSVDSLVKGLYSSGEISLPQFDELKSATTTRNRLVHGYEAPDAESAFKRLFPLARALESSWVG